MKSQVRKISLVGAIILTVVVLLAVSVAGNWVVRTMRATGLTPSVLYQLIFNGGMPLLSHEGRTNVLVLGIGGGDHEGPNLTDTIMLLSFDHAKQSLALISVPRDVWSDDLKDKINSAYAYGEEKKSGSGLLFSRVTMEDMLNVPIHYGILVDFSGFRELIDLVGGVDVTVPRAFTDTEFPREGIDPATCKPDDKACIYQTIHFDAGKQRMDGKQALTYVRSRHAAGEEGSDFARSKRQQDVLVALKEKLVRPQLWFTPQKATQFMDILNKSVKTDMTMGQLATIGKYFRGVEDTNIRKISIEDKLVTPPTSLYGRYVLVPEEDWDTIAKYISTELQR